MLDKFTSVLFEPEDIVEIRCIPRNRGSAERAQQFWTMAEDVGDLAPKLEKLNGQGRNIFVGVLPRASSGVGEDEDALSGRVLWADIEEIAPERALKRLQKLKLPTPTMALNSGNGVHAYWKLDETAYPEDLSVAVYSLAKYVMGDAKVFNPSRVMRLPGYLNTKYAPDKKMCEIIHFDGDLTYSLSDLTSVFPSERLPGLSGERKLPEGTKVSPDREEALKRALLYLEAVPGVPDGGGRNNKAHELAKRLRDKGLDKDEAYMALRDGWNPRCSPAMDLQELYACVENGFKYARKDAGCEPFEFAEEEERAPRQKGRKREERPEKPKQKKVKAPEKGSYTEMAMGRFREQADGTLNVINLPWESLAESCPIIFPRKIGIITGNPGVCKSWFAMHLCKAVQDAGHKARYLPLEDDLAYYLQRGASISSGSWEPSKRISKVEKSMRERFLARLQRKYGQYFEWWGDVVEENPTICDDGEIRAIDSDWILDWAEEECDKGARLLIIDSLAQIEFSGREEWKAQATFWRQLLGIANRSNATILMIIHLSKSAKGDFSSIYSVEASKRFGDLAFSVLGLQQVALEEHKVQHDDMSQEFVDINTIVHNMKCREGTLAMGSKAAFRFGRNGPSFEDHGFVIEDKKEKDAKKKK